MAKNKTIERVLRLLITLVGVGVGALVAALVLPVLRRHAVHWFFAAAFFHVLSHIGV